MKLVQPSYHMLAQGTLSESHNGTTSKRKLGNAKNGSIDHEETNQPHCLQRALLLFCQLSRAGLGPSQSEAPSFPALGQKQPARGWTWKVIISNHFSTFRLHLQSLSERLVTKALDYLSGLEKVGKNTGPHMRQSSV